MKKLILLFVIVFLVSCNRNIIEPLKTEENVFQSNKEKILKMNSSELSAFPISIQILAFENKSSLDKSNLFKNKFSNIIQQNFLSTEKNNVLRFAIANLNSEVFDNAIIGKQLVSQLELKTKLANFSDEEINAIFYMFGDVIYENGKIKIAKANTGRYEYMQGPIEGDYGGEDKCNLRWCLTCGAVGNGYDCDNPCVTTTTGCGMLWLQECTKICK